LLRTCPTDEEDEELELGRLLKRRGLLLLLLLSIESEKREAGKGRRASGMATGGEG